MAPSFSWEIGTGTDNDGEENGGADNGETQDDEEADRQHTQQEDAPILPPIPRVSTSRSQDDFGIQIEPMSSAGLNR